MIIEPVKKRLQTNIENHNVRNSELTDQIDKLKKSHKANEISWCKREELLKSQLKQVSNAAEKEKDLLYNYANISHNH